MSPHNMVATTIGDQLKLATDFRSKVIGVAMKDRAAILPAGHSADAAYWYDNAVGHFVSSSYYMDKLPAWVEDFNKQNNSKPGLDLKNIGNLFNRGWGLYYASAYNRQILQVVAVDADEKGNMTPTYAWNDYTLTPSDFYSRWRCQLGIRVTF